MHLTAYCRVIIFVCLIIVLLGCGERRSYYENSDPRKKERSEILKSYNEMDCFLLENSERRLQNAIVRLQRPGYLDRPHWNGILEQWKYVNLLLQKKCNHPYTNTNILPYAPLKIIPSEKDLHELIAKARKGNRHFAADKMLMAGAEAGYLRSQYELGMVYWVNRDEVEAEKWLGLAELQGSQTAREGLRLVRGCKTKKIDFNTCLSKKNAHNPYLNSLKHKW